MNPDAYDFEGRAHFEGAEIVLDFGKHQGERLSEVPRGYLAWAVDEDFPEDLVTVMEEEMGRR